MSHIKNRQPFNVHIPRWCYAGVAVWNDSTQLKEVAMLKKLTVITILIALVVSAFPTAGVLASSHTNKELEQKWELLVNNYNRQEMDHVKALKWAEAWLAKNKTAKDRSIVERHLSVCESAMVTAQEVVARHTGFSANGKVINNNLAYKSIKDLSNALRTHAASVKKIAEDVK
jgi:hypothetical protein